MHTVVLLLSSFACVGHGYRLQVYKGRMPDSPCERCQHSQRRKGLAPLVSPLELGTFSSLQALAKFLIACSPAVSFIPSIQGSQLPLGSLCMPDSNRDVSDAQYRLANRVTVISMSDESAPSEVEKLQLKAEKLKLQAEKAALEIEMLELEASGVKPISPSEQVQDKVPLEENPLRLPVEPMQISSNIKFVGPYPCLSLRFPKLGTAAQRERNQTGVTLDFILDTAANTNTINAAVAQELVLQKVGSVQPGMATSGALDGADNFMLGECQLFDRLDLAQGETNPQFMRDLTAATLAVPPVAAGILGVYFLNSFPGGVEFNWGENGTDALPSVSFYGDTAGMQQLIQRKNLVHTVPIISLPDTGLPSVKLRVNGVDIPALLDTGSPITVLNSAAASLARLQVIDLDANTDSDNNGFNPFAKLAQGFKSTQAKADAMTKGDLLMIASAKGEPVELLRTKEEAKVSLGEADFGATKLFVGNLPGLAYLNGLEGENVPPTAVLGVDVLRTRPRMFYRSAEVYF